MPLKGLEGVSLAYGLNHYRLDRSLREVLRLHLKGREPHLDALGMLAGREVYEIAYRVDQQSHPLLLSWSIRGERLDRVWLDPAERRLLEDLIVEHGVNRRPFEPGGTWHEHYAALNLVGDPGIACLLTITVQTAYALWKYGEGDQRDRYKRLTGLSPPLELGATWFTEVQGGSDLGANQTTARLASGGRWLLNGYKYFASGAGLADVALVTARPPGAPKGVRGLALFLVPRQASGGGLNYHVRRLKTKSGTIPVPTGEVELTDSEAYLIGEASLGVYYTLEDLNVSRLANSAGALGIARKAYLEAYLYTLERKAFGKRLVEHPLVQRDLLEMEALIEAGLHLTHQAIQLFQESIPDKPPSYTPRYHHARLLTHVVKNVTAEAAARVTRLAMELLGGLGFLREFPVERWHREALITPIWEGTSNIQALDMLEAISRKGAHRHLLELLGEKAREAHDKPLAQRAVEHVRSLIQDALAAASTSQRDVEFAAKDLLLKLGHAASVVLLENAALHLGEERLHNIAEMVWTMLVEGKTPQRPPERVIHDITSLGGSLPH